MTYAPATLQNLRSYLVGVGAPVLGIVGNPATHKRGYHIGAPLLPGDYSAIQPRDKAGLTAAASAIDIGRFNRLIGLGRHLVYQGVSGRETDMREVIAERSDGSHIYRWDRVTGKVTGHLDSDELPHHIHVSYFRDSQKRTKLPPFQAFFAPVEEEPMFSVPGIVSRRAPAGTPVYDTATATTPSGKTSAGRRYLLTAQDHPTNPTRYQVDGAYMDGQSARMSWLPASALTDPQDESYNAGAAAAARAAAEVKRS